MGTHSGANIGSEMQAIVHEFGLIIKVIATDHYIEAKFIISMATTRIH